MVITDEMKERIRETILDELKYHGWKQGDDDLVIHHLPQIWRRLCKDGLMVQFIESGFNYAQFTRAAKSALFFKTTGIKFR